MDWSNREDVLRAVQENGCALQYASSELKGDREVVLAAFYEDRRALKYASDELRKEIKREKDYEREGVF